MSKDRKYFDANKLIHTIYHKIAVWHNNEERLSDIELGRELKFLSKDIAEDVLKEVFGEVSIEVDKEKLGMTKDEIKAYDEERKNRREELGEKLKDAVKNDEGTAAS